MPKFVFMPPQDDLRRAFAVRLSDELPEYDVLSPETDEDAIEAIRDADARIRLDTARCTRRRRKNSPGCTIQTPVPSSDTTTKN